MADSQQAKLLLLREAFNLIKTQSLYRETQKHAINVLVQTLNKIILFRSKKVLNKLKALGLTRRLSYVVTQSMKKIYYLIDYKLYSNKKIAFDTIRSFAIAKNLFYQLNIPLQIPRAISDKEQKTMMLKNNKAIAAMKMLSIFRRLSLYNQKTIKLFRKWQLEDLRSLVDEYEITNDLFLTTLRNLSVKCVVGRLAYARRRTLHDALFTIMKNINSIQQTKAQKLRKLSNVLLKKKITDSTMTLDLSVVVTFKKFFKSLVEAHNKAERTETQTLKAVSSICFSFRKSLAHNFRQFYQSCHIELQPPTNGHVDGYQRSQRENIQLKHFVSTLSSIFIRRKMSVFSSLFRESQRRKSKVEKLDVGNISDFEKELQAKSDSKSLELLKIVFSNLKQAVKNNKEEQELKKESVLLLTQVLGYASKNNIKSAFYELRRYAKSVALREQEEEKENNQVDNCLIEKYTIRNQATIAAYFEKRINEIGVQAAEKRKQLLLRKILLRKLANTDTMKRSFFRRYENLMHEWKYSIKMAKINYKKELEAQKESLSKRFIQLSEEALQGTDPGLKYLEYVDTEHTRLRMRMLQLLKLKKGGIYSP